MITESLNSLSKEGDKMSVGISFYRSTICVHDYCGMELFHIYFSHQAAHKFC